MRGTTKREIGGIAICVWVESERTCERTPETELIKCGVAVSVEPSNTGDPAVGREVKALVEHALSDRAGDWRVSIIGSRANDNWEMKVEGPNGFERSYTLAGSVGEHQPSRLLKNHS